LALSRFPLLRSALLHWAWLSLARAILAADCNQNGIDDALETSSFRAGFELTGTLRIPETFKVELADLDGDGDLDLCQ